MPWKGSMDSQPPCISSEATKIIPIDLQEAWNQSISSLESLASPPVPQEPQHPRISALSRLAATARLSGSAQFSFPGNKEEDEERIFSQQQQEMQPLMVSGRQAAILAPNSVGLASSRRRYPCMYLRNLVTTPPSSAEPHSRKPTQL